MANKKDIRETNAGQGSSNRSGASHRAQSGSGITSTLKWMCIAALVGSSSYIYSEMQRANAFMGVGKVYTSENTTSCRVVGKGILHGCEDIVVDPETGLAYLACGNVSARQHWLHPDDEYDFANEAGKDYVYVMNEKNEYNEVKVLEERGSELVPFSQDFRVHGFDIYWDPSNSDDMTFMFVNHQLDHNAISIFSHRRGSDYMVHQETVKSSLLQSPNDVLAISKRSFYATNDMKYFRGFMRGVSNTVGLPNGHVVYRGEDGVFKIAADRIKYPNGITKNGEWIYVASCLDPGVQIYKQGADNELIFQGRTIYKDRIPDNLSVDHETGHIYSTGFLKIGETYRYFHNPSLNTTKVAGTRVVRLTQNADPKDGFETESVLVDSGELIPSATVAVVQRRNEIKRLLIGCVMCDSIAVCDNVI